MSSPRPGFVLVCNPKKHQIKKMIYKSDKEVSVTASTHDGSDHSFLGIHFTESHDMKNQFTTTIPFASEEKRDAFETALKNNDAKSALKIIEEIYPNYESEREAFLNNTVKSFLRDYIGCQTLQQQQTASDHTSLINIFGIHKQEKYYANHEVVEQNDPKLVVQSIFPPGFLEAMGAGTTETPAAAATEAPVTPGVPSTAATETPGAPEVPGAATTETPAAPEEAARPKP
jgi:hypothetical protein